MRTCKGEHGRTIGWYLSETVTAEEMVGLLIFLTEVLGFWFEPASCQLQSLSISPTNLEVTQGQTAIFHCHVSHQAGAVQWSKGGLLLGFNRTIPGFPRYSVEGDSDQGIHDLKIEDVQLDDETEFQCQVGPAGDHPKINASAHLTVLLPATSIQISGHANGSKVKVNQSRSLTLTCEVKGAKPPAQIRWYRNDVKLRADVSKNDVVGKDGKQFARSKLTVHPLPDDNRASYMCESIHQAMVVSLRYKVTLDVLFAPGRPTIEGYREGETVRMGDTVILRCISRGGNPLAQLIWKKNEVVVDYSYTTSVWESVNSYSLVANASDDCARYTCSASSIFTPEPMETSLVFTVFYAPSKVTIRGAKEAKAGDVVTLTCTTEKSNPASEVSWVVDGRPMASESVIEEEENGGWKTNSQLTVNITQQERTIKLFSCYAINQALGETIVGTFTISILYAPDPPTIFGYSEGFAIRAGSLQRLTCVSHGGNPLPTLSWYKGSKKIPEVQVISNGNVVSGEITVVASDSDNGAEYRCETFNSATANPLIAAIFLTVHFPPNAVTIRVKPKKPKSGQKVSIYCSSGSSNPPANITWWREGVELEPLSYSYSDGVHGGTVTKSNITLNVTSDDDQSIFTCQAKNTALMQSVHDAITLRIYYKPVFAEKNHVVYKVKEGDTWFVNLTGQANPSEVTYVWMKGNSIVWEGSSVNVSSVRRNDTGNYTLKATNDVGTSEVIVVLEVLYPVSVQIPTDVLKVDQGSRVQLECLAFGYPLTENTITWKRSSYDMKKTKIYATKGRSLLSVTNVSRIDSGEFTCVGSNGIGAKDKKTATLLVTHKPIIKQPKDSSEDKVVSDRGTLASLVCIAEGVPNVSFVWSKEGAKINKDQVGQQILQENPTLWKSILTIKKVQAKDFGEYSCVARNDLGSDVKSINLEPDSSPDPPIAVKIVNVSYDSMYLSWLPGFDGGHNQSYRIQYQSSDAPYAMYLDVHPPNVTNTWVTGLEEDQVYSFSLMSINIRGSSAYSTDKIKAKTLVKPPDEKPKPEYPKVNGLKIMLSNILITTFSVVFLVLFVLNIILLACYYKKKKLKKKFYSDDGISSTYGSETEMSRTEQIFLSHYSSTVTKKSSLSSSDEYSYQEKSTSDTESTHSSTYKEISPEEDNSHFELSNAPPAGYFI